MTIQKPLILHMNPVRFTQNEWKEFGTIADVVHIGEYSREEFVEDLHGKYSLVVAIARGYITAKKVGMFDKELIAHFPESLKYIAHQGAGYDQCDAKALSQRGIQLANCPHVINNPTADVNLYLLLGAMRNLEEARRCLVNRQWPQKGFAAGAALGFTPKNKILGIIGMGGIGRAFRDRAAVLGFSEILYYNRTKLPENLEKGAKYVPTVEELAAQADVVSLNCPLNESTYHLVNEKLISMMKDGVIIINTARGSIIDEKSLIKYLKNGKIGAAGLDVYENEPQVPEELLKLPNVLTIPHMGAQAVQTIEEMEMMVLENIRCGISEGRVLNLVPDQKFSFPFR